MLFIHLKLHTWNMHFANMLSHLWTICDNVSKADSGWSHGLQIYCLHEFDRPDDIALKQYHKPVPHTVRFFYLQVFHASLSQWSLWSSHLETWSAFALFDHTTQNRSSQTEPLWQEGKPGLRPERPVTWVSDMVLMIRLFTCIKQNTDSSFGYETCFSSTFFTFASICL